MQTTISQRSLNLDISSLTSGIHTLAVRGVDIAGNVGTQSAVTVYKDNQAPIVSAFDYLPIGWTTQNESSYVFTFSDNINNKLIKNVSLRIDRTNPDMDWAIRQSMSMTKKVV